MLTPATIKSRIDQVPFPLGCEGTWQPLSEFTALPASLFSWLAEKGSLTQRLKQHCSEFSVQVLGQGEATIDGHERALFAADIEAFVVREVILWCDQQPWVFARTVIPESTLSGPEQKIAQLGSQPLGAMLFQADNMSRHEITCARFAKGSPLQQLASEICIDGVDEIWGRRSMFCLSAKPLLVQEVFLPAAVAYQVESHDED